MSNILIIGGTKGIGFSLANQLAKPNNVTVLGRSSNDQLDSTITFKQIDILSEEFIYDGDQLDGLVYCPGSINLKPFNRLTTEDFYEDLNINLIGAIKIIQSNLNKLKSSNNASIVLFSTVAVSQGMPFHTSVAAAKGAIEGFGKSLAAELAPKIRVNIIAPSVTDTPLASKLLSSADKKEKSGERHPLKRVGEPHDIANAAEFLLSKSSSWITGQVIGVDGGMSALRML